MKQSEEKKNIGKVFLRVVLAVLAVAFCVFLSIVILQCVAQPVQMEVWMKRYPFAGRLVYVAMSLFQVVVAVVPGEPVELAGGYVFGALEGTFLYLLGATLGSLLIFVLVRKYGTSLVELFFEKKKLEDLRFLRNSKRRNILLSIFFILPGTPKDLLCYFAGLTDIKFKVWVWVCSIGRLPSVISSMLGGDALETRNYTGALMVLGITVFVSGMGLLWYNYICKRHKSEDGNSSHKIEESK